MANYLGSNTFTIPRPIVYKNGVNATSITASGITLTLKSSMVQILTNATGGTQDVTLPTAKNGLSYWIKSVSGSTGNITVKLASGTLISTVTADTGSYIISDGSDWFEVING